MKTIIRKINIPSNDIRLKRHVNHDSRSKKYAFDTADLKIVNVEHKRLVPVFNQGNLGSCTGNAGIGNVNTSPFIQSTNPAFSPDESGAVKLYSEAEKIDGGVGYPPEDIGSSGLSIAKVLKKVKMISGYQHTFTLNDALKALSKYPIITGTYWYDGMFTPDADGRVHPIGKVVGGHEYEAYKVDADNGKIWFYNSWGTDWGIGGTFYMTWADYHDLLAQRGDVTVLIPPTVTPPKPAKYIYFKPGEIVGLQDSLVSMLDTSRGISNTPYVITSGFRTPEQNKAVGGVTNSSHLRGLAADIACTNINRGAILKGLLTCGTPVFIEVAEKHIHVDVDSTIHALDTVIISTND